MKIEILHMTPGAAQAKGVTVIIDVFRAFSFESWALNNGAEAVYPIADINAAYELHREHPDWLLAGERGGKKQEGFHFGNSPWEIHALDLTGKNLVHTTSAGTQGLIAAKDADCIFLGALVNAKATAEAIRRLNPEHVSLVAMGYNNLHPTEEDTFCAEYLRALLLDEPFDKDAAVKIMREGPGARFFMPDKQSYQPEQDFHLCVEWDRFDFAIRAERLGEGKFRATKLEL